MKKSKIFFLAALTLVVAFTALFFGARAAFPQKYRNVVTESGIEPALVYAVMKAESGFDEHARSRAGAVGIMQIKPSTAEFICTRENLPFDAARLTEGEYNALIGCKYLRYLLEKFEVSETALAAYNAGEGTVAKWLEESDHSDDGKHLKNIPYQETRRYVKKVLHYCKTYRFLY